MINDDSKRAAKVLPGDALKMVRGRNASGFYQIFSRGSRVSFLGYIDTWMRRQQPEPCTKLPDRLECCYHAPEDGVISFDHVSRAT